MGSGAGLGKNVNITWNKHRDRPSLPLPHSLKANPVDDKIGDPEYLAAFHHLIMPIATEFNPDLVPLLPQSNLTIGLRLRRLRRRRRPLKRSRRPARHPRRLRNDDPPNHPPRPRPRHPRPGRRLRTRPPRKLCNRLS